MELKNILIFYDCDWSVEHFDDWFWGFFWVDDVQKAKKLFNEWLEEYFNSEELMNKTDRYSHIIARARQYGYKYETKYNDYGGFGC